MTRLASRLVRDGEIGALRLVQVEYIQGGLAARIEDGPADDANPLAVRSDAQRPRAGDERDRLPRPAPRLLRHRPRRRARVRPKSARSCRAAASSTTCRPWSSSTAAARGRSRRSRRRPARRTTSGCASTASAGMVDWSHRECSYLRLSIHGEPARVIGRGDPGLPPEIIKAGRAPRGHPEGLLQAFANIYAEVAQERMARRPRRRAAGVRVPAHRGRRAHDGVHRGLPGVARGRRMGRRRAHRGRRRGRRKGIGMTRIWIVLALLMTGPAAALAQPVFAGHEIFPPSEFAARRARVIETDRVGRRHHPGHHRAPGRAAVPPEQPVLLSLRRGRTTRHPPHRRARRHVNRVPAAAQRAPGTARRRPGPLPRAGGRGGHGPRCRARPRRVRAGARGHRRRGTSRSTRRSAPRSSARRRRAIRLRCGAPRKPIRGTAGCRVKRPSWRS